MGAVAGNRGTVETAVASVSIAASPSESAPGSKNWPSAVGAPVPVREDVRGGRTRIPTPGAHVRAHGRAGTGGEFFGRTLCQSGLAARNPGPGRAGVTCSRLVGLDGRQRLRAQKKKRGGDGKLEKIRADVAEPRRSRCAVVRQPDRLCHAVLIHHYDGRRLRGIQVAM